MLRLGGDHHARTVDRQSRRVGARSPLGVCPGAGRLLTAVCAPMLGNNALRYLEADHLGAQRAADD